MGTELAVPEERSSIAIEIRAFGAELRPNGLILLKDEITPEKFEALAWYLSVHHEMIKWAIGDLEFQGEAIFGEDVYQYLEILGLSTESKRQYLRVAGDVPIQRRRTELSWSHHRSVAPLEPDEQVEWLQRAVDNRWTKAELEAAIKEWRGIVDPVRRPYVVEAVCDAAEHVIDAVKRSEEPIPEWIRPEIEELVEALGEDL